MEPRTVYLIKRAEIEVTSRMGAAFSEFGITPIQFAILYFMNYAKGDLSSAQLSRRFSMTPQSMNELVAVLVRKKLIKKTVDPAHRRILRINLTAKGVAQLKGCNAALNVVERDLLKNLPARKLRDLRDSIRIILETGR